jgi:hypothetical protein
LADLIGNRAWQRAADWAKLAALGPTAIGR